MLTNWRTRTTPGLSGFSTLLFLGRLVFLATVLLVVIYQAQRLKSYQELNQLLIQKTELQDKLEASQRKIIARQDTLIANQEEMLALYRKLL